MKTHATLPTVTVLLKDGTSYKTSVSGSASDDSIRSYFIGTRFDRGSNPEIEKPEDFKLCVGVSIDRSEGGAS